MGGTDMKARMTPPLRTFRPMGASKRSMMSGFMIMSPMKPQTTEGMAARSSVTILSTSRRRPPANSLM
jgi:hypothetical protein